MITVIKDVEVYSPKYLGKKQVVITSNVFEGIYDEIKIPKDFVDITEIDGKGYIMFPGFIDNHVHIIGGGGEGGFSTRTREINFSELTKAGVTTVVGCLGTDGVCRDINSLIAKARVLEEEGITTYCYSGSYEIPVKTVTSGIKEDLMLIDKIIGVGEIALSDHRSSQPKYDEFVNTVAKARVGGLLSGKAGIVNVHLGGGAKKLEMLFSLIRNTEIPATQLLPTHINRSSELFEMGMDYLKEGGFIDLTTSSNPEFLEPGELRASEGLKKIYDMNLPLDKVTFSSDAQGSMPLFNEKRELIGLGICSVETLYGEVRDAILNKNVPIEDAIAVITSNVAEVLKFNNLGRIQKNYQADFVLVDKDTLKIDTVYAKGRALIKNKEVLVKGTFEN